MTETQDPKRSGDLLVTIGKLITIMTGELGLVAWIFASIVDTKVQAIRQDELAFRQLYEIRHQQLKDDITTMRERQLEIDKRLVDIERRATDIERPIKR